MVFTNFAEYIFHEVNENKYSSIINASFVDKTWKIKELISLWKKATINNLPWFCGKRDNHTINGGYT